VASGTVLVTGASGFIGLHVVDTLLACNRSVLAFDHVDRRASHAPGVGCYLGDIRDEAAVAEAMAHCGSWIHLAGVLGTQETIQYPRSAAEINVLGGLNVLEQAARVKAPGVNIAVGNYWMDNTYSITKSLVERFCSMYRVERGLPVTVVRALNCYGPGQSVAAPYGQSRVRKIIPSFIARALHGDPIEVYGDGSQVMDMIFVTDVAAILVDALEHAENGVVPDFALEAGTGRRTTVLEIAETVCDVVGVDRSCISHLPMRPGEPEHSVVLGDPSTLRVIGHDDKSFCSLEDGIEQTVKYFKGIFLL
jgi:UDP-glucose 4-epimerase